MICLISNTTDVCDLFSHPRVRIPTADCESEKSITFLTSSFSISSLMLSNAILMAINSPRRIDDLVDTGCFRSTLSSFGRNKHAPAQQQNGKERISLLSLFLRASKHINTAFPEVVTVTV